MAQLRRNYVDERRTEQLYRRLAHGQEASIEKSLVEMADSEHHHAQRWGERIVALGGSLPTVRPGAREVVLPWIARVGGIAAVLTLIAGGEARGKLDYLRQARFLPDAEARAIAHTIVPEERQHQETATQIKEQMGSGSDSLVRMYLGDFIRDAVFGLNDGLVSNFSLIAGVAAASVSQHVVVLTGTAGLLAGAVSMAAGSYLSNKSHREVVLAEVSREREEIEFAPEEEREELIQSYGRKGFSPSEAELLVSRITQDKERWLALMVNEELGLSTDPGPSPIIDGAVTGSGFALGAFFPLLPFLFIGGLPALAVAAVLSLLALFGVGASKAPFTARSWVRSGLEMVIVGAIAAAFTFVIGSLFGGHLFT